MGVAFTKEQQQVINLRNRNLLVAAAAGSGKTAVLVERIIQKIISAENPVDIDRLLIVTFTNAAAAEMRERIGEAIDRQMERFPENVHLQKQQTLLQNAQITTIHSFCLNVIRNYFHCIDLEPDFRIGDEGELKLLKSDVLDDVLENFYQAGEPEFIRLAETLATGKNDIQLKELVLSLYEFSMSYPWPLEWLEQCKAPYQAATVEAFEAIPLGQVFLEYLRTMCSHWSELMAACVEISQEEDGPQIYEALLEQELTMLEQTADSNQYQEFYDHITAISFARLPAARKYTGDSSKKQLVQDTRNAIKESRKKMLEQFFFQPPEQMIIDLQKNKELTETLLAVVFSFGEAFAAKKQEQNMLDFNDLEHFALQILVDTDTKEPSPTARELQRLYEEIMIDEYQDSNFVQETILKSVSGKGRGENNLFMVGDVKQSIYRFRMARPELFMEKYDTYTETDSPNQRIDLHKNFRSRTTVLDTVNDIFYRIMGKDLGNVAYDEQAALYPGMEFVAPPQEQEDMFQTEVLALDVDAFKAAEEEAAESFDAKEGEAVMIAVKLQEMFKTQLVTDKQSGMLRPAAYGDVVILLRGLGTFAQRLVQILADYGIPAQATTSTGYFSALEVQTMLNMLRLIDNPRQDIPMAAVLHSPIGGFSSEEIARIRIPFLDIPFYQCVFRYQEEGTDVVLKQKVQQFLCMLRSFRNRVNHTSIHELLYQVMEETGYWDYAYALCGGEIRRANLEMLLEKAISYEATSYRGLFHFIRYINQLQKYEVDFGEAEGEGMTNAVRIMTIHKSKGLEFPIVLLSNLGKQFNQQDIRNRLVLHPQLGIGLDIVDLEKRTRTPAITRQIISRKIQIENAGEELRVLYVALTRAREKLILTGTIKKGAEKLAAMEYQLLDGQDKMGFLARLGAGSFFDWILPSLKSYNKAYNIKLIGPEYLTLGQLSASLKQEISKKLLLQSLKLEEPEWKEAVAARLSFSYPFAQEEGMKTKLSVSELKHRAADLLRQQEQEISEQLIKEPATPYVPAFMQPQTTENKKAIRGTAIHRVLECFDFTREFDTLTKQLEEMVNSRRLDKELYALITVRELKQFFQSNLAKRMQSAAKNGCLYRERPFVMGRPANQVWEDISSETMILIQGIVDAYFEEDGKLVLVDYKTDKIKDGQELIKRYGKQMELYQEALERVTGKPVKQQILYSVTLQSEIELKCAHILRKDCE